MPGNGPMFDRVRALGFETARIDCGPYASGTKTAGDRARFLFETPRLARQIRALARGCDLVYINGPRLLPAAALSGNSRARGVSLAQLSSARRDAQALRLGAAQLRRAVIASCRYVAEPWRPYAARLP